MTFSYLQTSTAYTKSLDLNQKSQSTILTVDPDGDYLKFDAYLQRYNDVDPFTLVTFSLHHAIELTMDFQTKEHPIPLIVTEHPIPLIDISFKAGKKTKIEVRIRDNEKMVQLSTVVHKIERGDILSTKKRKKKSCYLLLMTMMRLNSLLSRIPFGGRICACNDGQFIFSQDVPMSILRENGRLRRKLDDFFITTVWVCLGFDQTSGISNLAQKT